MADWPAGFQRQEIALPQGRTSCWSGGEGPALFCLHGFPDTVDTWQPVAAALARRHTVHAICMPGYEASSAQADYSLPALADTVTMLIESLSPGRPVRLLGHDWGAVIACTLASQRPTLVERLVMAAVPHVRRFLKPSLAQLKRSWYMGYFQLPGLPERRIVADEFAFLDRLWRDWSPGWRFTAEDIAPLKQAFADPAVLRAALAYYRALPAGLLRAALPGPLPPQLALCPVPTLALAGEQDGCIGVEVFSAQAHLFPAGYRFQALADAGHFMHREQSQAFADAVLEWLA